MTLIPDSERNKLTGAYNTKSFLFPKFLLDSKSWVYLLLSLQSGFLYRLWSVVDNANTHKTFLFVNLKCSCKLQEVYLDLPLIGQTERTDSLVAHGITQITAEQGQVHLQKYTVGKVGQSPRISPFFYFLCFKFHILISNLHTLPCPAPPAGITGGK